MRTAAFALALVLGAAASATAQRDEGGFCRIITRHPPSPLTRALLRDMVEEARSSLPGCLAYDDLRSASVDVLVEPGPTVSVTARTAPHRDALAEECLSGNARDRLVRLIEPYEVRSTVRVRVRVTRDEVF